VRARGPLTWVLAVAAGILVLLVVSAALADDDSGETVPAGEWVQTVCGSFGVWRGQLESIVDDVRNAPAFGSLGAEEPQSETPQGRTAFVRAGLERAVLATATMVDAVDNAGVPDTPNGEEAAARVSDWADQAHDDLEDAQDALDDEADSLEQAVDQVATAVRAIGAVLASGVQTNLDIARTDPALAATFLQSSTCRELREETGR
jgi:hypothetical protein